MGARLDQGVQNDRSHKAAAGRRHDEEGAHTPATDAGPSATAAAAMKDAAILLNELRYAERVCERQARLYRRGQFVGGWLSIFGATATVGAVAAALPHWLQVTSSMIAVGLGVAFQLMRLGDKAAAIEAHAKGYAAARSAPDLAVALQAARAGSPPEVEALRNVCFNDVLREIGHQDLVVPLSAWERAVAAVA